MLKQRFLVQFGSTVIIHFVGMLAGIVVARIAGPSVVGIISYGTAYVSLFGFINGLFGSAHIKLVSEGRDHAECMAVYSRLRAISSLIYLAATAGWFLIQKYVMHYPFESREVQIVIVFSLFAHYLNIYNSYAGLVYTANLKQAKANIPKFTKDLLWHIGRVVIVLLGFRAVAISGWNLLLTALLVPVIYNMLREYPRGKYNPKLAKEYFSYAVPTLIIVVVNSVTHYADKLLLAHYTDTTQLGYYSAAHSIGGMFMLIAVPVGNIFFPLFSGLIARNNWKGVSDNIRRYQEFIVLFVFPLICALAVAGGPGLLLILGSRYRPSINPFIILLFATYIVIWGMPYGNILSGMGKFYVAAWINASKLAVFVVSVIIFLSPKYLNLGAIGLALNLLVLNAFANGMFLYFARKFGDLQLGRKNQLRHLLIIVITVGGYFLSLFLKERMNLWWIAYIPLNLALIYALLIMFRLIGKEHWRLLADAANFRKTIAYVNDEMRGNDQ